MKNESSRSLKSMNMKWLVTLAAFDMLVVLLFVVPDLLGTTTPSQLAIGRGLTTSLMPVVVLLLTGVLSHDVKAILVFWKIKNVMPGSQAFTRYGPADPRIDMAALKKNVGALPIEPAEQNSKWYKLYQMVKSDTAVIEAHRLYLMYRDMAALSLPLIVVVPVALYFTSIGASALWAIAALFAVQFLVSAIAARNSGIRFVCNVLAVHSTKKITNPKAAGGSDKKLQ